MRPVSSIAFLVIITLSVGFARHGRGDDVRVPTSSWSNLISRDRPDDQAAALRNLNASVVAFAQTNALGSLAGPTTPNCWWC
jgi:hypothetical protein